MLNFTLPNFTILVVNIFGTTIFFTFNKHLNISAYLG